MLNQVATEALFSATYVENYLDCVENLPDDLQRHLTRMRELDVSYRACIRDVENNLNNCMLPKDEGNTTRSNKRARAIMKIQQSLIAAQELGDEKLQVVQLIQDLIDHKSRQLDHDFRTLESHYGNGNNVKEESMSVEPPASAKELCNTGAGGNGSTQAGGGGTGGTGAATRAPASPPHNHDRERDRDKDRTGERASKRARRSRTDGVANNDNDRGNGAAEGRGGGELRGEPPAPPPPPPPPPPDPPQRGSQSTGTSKKTGAGKLGTGKKKKRKSRQSVQNSQRDETPPPEDPDPIDPDEPTYCLCDQISFGEMILCDNDLCPIEWFHFSCVSLTTKPKGKWFCPKCRGDRPNVMKPKSQFLKELERYNKEKEEKA